MTGTDFPEIGTGLLLLDSSAWVEYLRRTGSPACTEVTRLLARPESLAITEPVIMELLGGRGSRAARREVERLTGNLTLLSVDARVDYHDAAAIFDLVRGTGRTVRRMIDCVIAAVAGRTDATLVHRDADFDAIAARVALRARRLP